MTPNPNPCDDGPAQVELGDGDGFELALKWIRRALYLTTVTPEFVKMAAQRKLSLVPAAVRNGSGISRALNNGLEFSSSMSNSLSAHAIQQQPFLTKLLASLETEAGTAEVRAPRVPSPPPRCTCSIAPRPAAC